MLNLVVLLFAGIICVSCGRQAINSMPEPKTGEFKLSKIYQVIVIGDSGESVYVSSGGQWTVDKSSGNKRIQYFLKKSKYNSNLPTFYLPDYHFQAVISSSESGMVLITENFGKAVSLLAGRFKSSKLESFQERIFLVEINGKEDLIFENLTDACTDNECRAILLNSAIFHGDKDNPYFTFETHGFLFEEWTLHKLFWGMYSWTSDRNNKMQDLFVNRAVLIK